MTTLKKLEAQKQEIEARIAKTFEAGIAEVQEVLTKHGIRALDAAAALVSAANKEKPKKSVRLKSYPDPYRKPKS